ncbi:MAG: CDP-alcohol phosphatidyltransferase family protein [Clostridia bacterium]|nr:CDP-alcohol phosphatidyltransferase family protein [Clostridia bacterium]
MANFITVLRIILAAAILFPAPLTPLFYIFYILAGLTDIADGTAARKLNSESTFGAKLDTLADLALFLVCFIKLCPMLNIPKWVYVCTAVIVFIKIINIVSGFVLQKKFVSVHSFMNKAVGAMLFLLPLTFKLIDIKYSAPFVLTAAAYAAIEEGHLIRNGKN